MAAITSNPVSIALIGVLSVFPSILPSIKAVKDNPNSCDLRKAAGLENKMLVLPVAYAAISLAVFGLVHAVFPDALKRYWVVGVLVGLVYPTLGWAAGLPQNVYGITSRAQLYAGAQLMYVLWYGVVVAWLARYMA